MDRLEGEAAEEFYDLTHPAPTATTQTDKVAFAAAFGEME